MTGVFVRRNLDTDTHRGECHGKAERHTEKTASDNRSETGLR